MTRVFAINGSPKQDKGNTALILEPLLRGLKENDADVQLFYASQLKVEPCSCGIMYCWRNPGECIINDSMKEIYPLLEQADLVVLATPKYIPLPGAMQNFLNRLCPLLKPDLQFRDGRTRARLRDDVHIRKFLLVATGGWWEWGNVETLECVVKELAEVASVEYAGTIFRPHARAVWPNGKVTQEGQKVLDAVKHAAYELIHDGKISTKTLAEISHPITKVEDYF